MSLFSYLFDNERRQRRDINELEDAASAGADAASTLQDDVAGLRRRLDRAELVLEAMFRVLQDKGVATTDELQTFIARVDLEDGFEDGRISATPAENAGKCPTCSRPANFRRRTHCVYCGAALAPPPQAAPYR